MFFPVLSRISAALLAIVAAVVLPAAAAFAGTGGAVYAWSYNTSGQPGNGTTNQSLTAIQIDPADLANIVAVAAGSICFFALSSDGGLWIWGLNNFV